MGISVSNDFILGLIAGVIVVLLFQQLTRMAGGIGRWMPLVLFALGIAGVIFVLVWTGS